MQITPSQQDLVKDAVNEVVGEALRSLWVIGSRARDKGRRGSDLDLLVEAAIALTLAQRTRLLDVFDESDLPFHVDLVDAMAIDEATRRRMLIGAVQLIG